MLEPDLLPEKIRKCISIDSDGCWMWTGDITKKGYARVYWPPKQYKLGGSRFAHVIVYKLLIGNIPVGKRLDHLCRKRSCVNPYDLEPVTNKENIRRGERASSVSCCKGHPYTLGSYTPLQRHGGITRRCLICHAIQQRAYYKRKGAVG